MPSLTALAGRAGDWDRAFTSATELKMVGIQANCSTVNGNISPNRDLMAECGIIPIWEQVFAVARQLVCGPSF